MENGLRDHRLRLPQRLHVAADTENGLRDPQANEETDVSLRISFKSGIPCSGKLRELLIDEEKLDALVKSLDQVTAS